VRRIGFTLALLMSASPSMASAQTAVLLPVGGDVELARAHSAELVARVQADFEESSFTVVSPVGDCADTSCAPTMLTAMHADLAVGIALWHRNGLVQVSVVLVDPHGVQVSADADGAESVIGQATTSAVAQARARWATRNGSPVRVIGAPDGASITVDREPWGTIPHEGNLSPGTHHFVVSAVGYVTERRDVEIAAATETIEIAFELVEGSDVVAPPPATGPDVGVMASGGVLAGIGAAVLAIGIANAVDTVHCVSGCDPGDPTRTAHYPATDIGIGLTVAGAAAMVGGVLLIIVGVLAGGTPSRVALDANGMTVSF